MRVFRATFALFHETWALHTLSPCWRAPILRAMIFVTNYKRCVQRLQVYRSIFRSKNGQLVSAYFSTFITNILDIFCRGAISHIFIYNIYVSVAASLRRCFRCTRTSVFSKHLQVRSLSFTRVFYPCLSENTQHLLVSSFSFWKVA